MELPELLRKAAENCADDEELKQLAESVRHQPEAARSALAAGDDAATLLIYHQVARAESPAQLSLAEALGRLGADPVLEAVRTLFGTLTHRGEALRAFMTGVQAGGHEDAVTPLVSAWVVEELGAERLQEAALDGGRFQEYEGIERAAKALASTLLQLPVGPLRSTAVDAMEQTLAADPSWAAGVMRDRVRDLLRTGTKVD